MRSLGIEEVKSAPRSPWQNPYVERVIGTLRRELVLKELRLFFRDTTQWSQLILLAVLVVVYVFNIKFLPLRTEGVTKALTIIIPFLNLVLAGFVLASIAARFIFPGVSLEGRTLWLLRSSPMPVRDLLWAKFWVGTAPLLVLAIGIVGVTDYLLQVSAFMFLVSVLSITLLTFAVSGMAIAFGTLFPQYETENAAQIPTSFGGLLFMMASITLIGIVVVLAVVALVVPILVLARSIGGQAQRINSDLGSAVVNTAALAELTTTIESAEIIVDGLRRGRQKLGG